MLEFYYDFVDVHIDRKDFQYCEMDTDSAYFAIAGDNLEAIIKPESRTAFYEEYDKWLPAKACTAHKDDFVTARTQGLPWNPPPCCETRSRYDKRTPGLFKEEWSGDGFVGLCSKTYFCFGTTDKASSKGINKTQNDLTKEKYMQVLEEQKCQSGRNQGFRVHQNQMFTYNQTKNGLGFFYPKRVVLDDGVSTRPLEI